MDNFSRECLAIVADQSLKGADVVAALEQIKRAKTANFLVYTATKYGRRSQGYSKK